MQYRCKLIIEKDGIVRKTAILTTPDIVAPSTAVDDKQYIDATKKRIVVGVVDGYSVSVDGFGQLFVWTPDSGEKKLSRSYPVFSGGDSLTVRPHQEYPVRVDGRSRLRRLWHWVLGVRCANCFHFDVKSASEWRDKVTHVFTDNQVGKMWDDVMKISAEQAGVPDIPSGQFGYCAKRKTALSGNLSVCEDWKRAAGIKKSAI